MTVPTERRMLTYLVYPCPGCGDGHYFCPPDLWEDEIHDREAIVYECRLCGLGLTPADYQLE